MAEAIAVQNPEDQPKRTTAGPERLGLFIKDVRQEMRKVVTPTRAEVQSTTTVVIVTVFIFAAFFFLVDFFLGNGIDWLFSHFIKH